jgi:hypothetical protein
LGGILERKILMKASCTRLGVGGGDVRFGCRDDFATGIGDCVSKMVEAVDFGMQKNGHSSAAYALS